MKIRLKYLLAIGFLSMTSASATDKSATGGFKTLTHGGALACEHVGSRAGVAGQEVENARAVEPTAGAKEALVRLARAVQQRVRIEAENTRLEGEIDRALDEMALLRGLLGGRGGAQRKGKER